MSLIFMQRPDARSNPCHDPGEKISRVVDLIIVMARTSEGFTVSELADQLGVTARTVQRYIRSLQHSSLDLTSRQEAQGGGRTATKWRVRL